MLFRSAYNYFYGYEYNIEEFKSNSHWDYEKVCQEFIAMLKKHFFQKCEDFSYLNDNSKEDMILLASKIVEAQNSIEEYKSTGIVSPISFKNNGIYYYLDVNFINTIS